MIILFVTKQKNTGPHVNAWPPHTPYVNYWVFIRKLVKVFLLDSMNSISINNVYIKYILIYPCSLSKLSPFQNSMIFHERLIQNSMIFPWFINFYKFQGLFMKFNDFFMNLKQIWISMIFQELWEPWPYPPCLRMADRALLARYPRHQNTGYSDICLPSPLTSNVLFLLKKFPPLFSLHSDSAHTTTANTPFISRPGLMLISTGLGCFDLLTTLESWGKNHNTDWS